MNLISNYNNDTKIVKQNFYIVRFGLIWMAVIKISKRDLSSNRFVDFYETSGDISQEDTSTIFTMYFSELLEWKKFTNPGFQRQILMANLFTKYTCKHTKLNCRYLNSKDTFKESKKKTMVK